MNIGTILPRHAQYRPNHLAIVFAETRLTFKQFNGRVNQVAHTLNKLGIQKGDKVATILPNCLEQLELYWAVSKTGAVIVPLSPMLRGSGLSRLINDSDTVSIITDTAFMPHLEKVRAELTAVSHFLLTDSKQDGYDNYHQLTDNAPDHNPPYVEISGSDPYNIIYSSGTTGLPKGIVHTHQIRAWYCTTFATSYRMNPASIMAHAGSLVFNGAFLTLMPAMFLGCPFILMPQFDPAALIELIYCEKITHIKMVPSQIIAMLHAPNFTFDKLQSLEMLGSVGAPLHLEHKQALARNLPGRFYELYGLTEGFMTILDRDDFAQKPNSVGIPPPLMEMRVERPDGTLCDPHEVGEIVGRGPMTMPGYYKRPDLSAQTLRNGWLHSGDLGYLDEDGFLYLVDRQKDMIISGGVNVYPRDIEEIIVQHPAVRETAVFGIPDPKWGETPMAAVILNGSQTITAEELQLWVNERVEARFQKVSQLLIMADFPRSTAGKTLKRVMREPYWEDKERKI